MLDDLKPYTMMGLSKELGTDPFELMRLRVMSQSSLSSLAMSSTEAERIRAFSGIERLCDRLPASTRDGLSGHLWVPALLALFLEKKWFGEQTIRMDNIWRGLSTDDTGIVKNVVQILINEGLLVAYSAVNGPQVAIHADRVEAITALVAGENIPASLAYLWKTGT